MCLKSSRDLFVAKVIYVSLFSSSLLGVSANATESSTTNKTSSNTEPTRTEATSLDSTSPESGPPPHWFWRELLERELDEMDDTYSGEPPVGDDVGDRTVALLDGRFEVICSGAAIALHWVLTASHCLVFIPKYIKTALSSKLVPVQAVYRHPKYNYEVMLRNTVDGGQDVVGLIHDIGLVKTKRAMHLPLTMDRLTALLDEVDKVDPRDLVGQRLTVFGFGRHDNDEDEEDQAKQINAGRGVASSLFKSTVMMVPCARPNWYPCVCGAATTTGVCAGDSGGPVFNGQVQIGITSLGPLKCGAGRTKDQGQTVFTAIRPYIGLINRTVYESHRLAGDFDEEDPLFDATMDLRPELGLMLAAPLFYLFRSL